MQTKLGQFPVATGAVGKNVKSMIGAAALLAALSAGLNTAAAGQAGVSVEGDVVSFTVPAQASAMIDFANARPMPLPKAPTAPMSPVEAMMAPPVYLGTPGISAPGGRGSSKATPAMTAAPKTLSELTSDAEAVAPQEWGTSNHPFTTNKVNAFPHFTASAYPFRAAGKLYFNIGSSTYVCSASLITPGVIVTAAHCVANYGAGQFYSGWLFRPSYNNGQRPYGTSTAAQAWVMTSYLFGTDGCAVYGVVCPNDVAVIILNRFNGAYIGNTTGWLTYGWDGYGFNSNNNALITQLGYPVSLDRGEIMQRTDSQAYVSGSFSNNSVMGSLQTGGSSGGPWVVNLGIQPGLSGGVRFGSEAVRNVVVGVTSWGYTDPTIKQQGASPFTSGNIPVLINSACSSIPGAC